MNKIIQNKNKKNKNTWGKERDLKELNEYY